MRQNDILEQVDSNYNQDKRQKLLQKYYFSKLCWKNMNIIYST